MADDAEEERVKMKSLKLDEPVQGEPNMYTNQPKAHSEKIRVKMKSSEIEEAARNKTVMFMNPWKVSSKGAISVPRKDATVDVVPTKPYNPWDGIRVERKTESDDDGQNTTRYTTKHRPVMHTLNEAVLNNDFSMVKYLLEHGAADPNQISSDCFMHIVHRNYSTMREVLIDGGLELNQDKYDLANAVLNRDEDKVGELLKSDADLSQILDYVVDKGDIRMLKVMVAGGLELSQFPDNVVIRILRSCDKRILEVLKEGGLELKQLPDNVLMRILPTSNKRIIQFLKVCGYELKQIPDHCIDELVHNCEIEMLKVLLEGGLELKKIPDHCIKELVDNREIGRLKVLLEGGLELKRIPDHCIHELVHNREIGMLKVLLEGGLELKKIPDLFIRKVLSNRHREMLKIFVEGGWDVNRIPVHCLNELGFYRDIEMLKVLLEGGLELKRISEDSMDYLVQTGDIGMLKVLLERGLELRQIPDSVKDRLDNDMLKILIERELELKRLTRLRRTQSLDGCFSEKRAMGTESHVRPRIRRTKSLDEDFHKKTTMDTKSYDIPTDTHCFLSTDVDSGLTSEGNATTKSMADAEQFTEVVQENDMKAFMSLEDIFVKAYPHGESPWRLLHIVAVYGTAEMVDCIQGWTRIDWDRQHTIHDDLFKLALKSPNFKEATALYLATFRDRKEIVKSLVKLAGEDNIQLCLKELPISNGMEQIYMLELADRLRQKHADLKPTIFPGHQNEDNGTKSRVFIVYSVSVVQTEDYDFNGLGIVKLRNPYVLKKAKTFSSVSEKDLSPEDAQRLREAIQTHRDRLWQRHSNLNIITGRYVKTKRNGSDIDEACVLLYCSSKGVIPLGEEEFPRTICIRQGDRINVVVREGFFRFGGYITDSSTRRHPTLKMGCEIGRLTLQQDGSGHCIPNCCGTLGPFVRYKSYLGFLSCSHVFFDIPTHSYCINFMGEYQVKVVQPSTDSTASDNTACGLVARAVFDPNNTISIDAAVVTLTDPSRVPSAGHFSNEHRSSYKNAGFDELPEYNNAFARESRDVNEFKPKPTVVKFGSKTDVTRGALNVVGTDVKPFAKELGFDGSSDKVLMKNQYLVTGIYPSMDFFDGGDSGSAVFYQDDNGQLVCVGMAIGYCVLNDYPYKAGIVTPIDAILQALGPNISLATLP